jgi:prophage antirepressor-like protein
MARKIDRTQIREFITNHPEMTNVAIGNALGVSEGTIRKTKLQMADTNKVVHEYKTNFNLPINTPVVEYIPEPTEQITDMTVFNSIEFGQIRTKVIDNEVWFIGMDIARALGYDQTANMTKLLDDSEFISSKLNDINANITLINEAGLYEAVFGSHKPGAKAFKKWVKAEVLPSIRKHGMYATTQTIETILNDPGAMIKILQTIQNERQQRLQAEAKLLEMEAMNKSTITVLDDKIELLTSYNDVLMGNIIQNIDYPTRVKSMILHIVAVKNPDLRNKQSIGIDEEKKAARDLFNILIGQETNGFYKFLAQRTKIDVALRQGTASKGKNTKPSKIKMVKDNEWGTVLATLITWYYQNGGDENYLLTLESGFNPETDNRPIVIEEVAV